VTAPQADPCIGVFDSGIGGLSVLRQIHQYVPETPTLYLADQAHLPYGPRPTDEIKAYTFAAARWMMGQGAQVIALACNTASAAALLPLRAAFPDFPFVGMEPAVKPAAEATRTGVIGVLATRTTAEGPLYQRVRQQYARDVQVITQVAPELVQLAEDRVGATPEGRAIVRRLVEPLVSAGADQIVLGCTHFPFLAPLIQEAAGEGVTLIDPAPAVARQVGRLWGDRPLTPSLAHRYFTTGDPGRFQHTLHDLLVVETLAQSLTWIDDPLRLT
jgi:glutamate racemase